MSTPDLRGIILAEARTNMPDADFWLQRKGSRSTIGKVHRQPRNIKEDIGIKVLQPKMVLPAYLADWYENLFNQGHWQPLAIGMGDLVSIKVAQVRATLPRVMVYSDDLGFNIPNPVQETKRSAVPGMIMGGVIGVAISFALRSVLRGK